MSADSKSSGDAVKVINSIGPGPVLLLCEHASNHIPNRYQGLGLDPDDANSHAAWDPGALDLATTLSLALDSPLIAGSISRLVYDCNRPPSAASAMPTTSERISVPGNRNLTPAMRAERVDTVYDPFCQAVAAVLKHRQAHGQLSILVTIHSFTPLFFDTRRAVEIGILHDSDARLADLMLAEKHRLPHRHIERNAPYGPQDGVTHSLQLHGLQNGLANVMVEVRNDLLTSPARIQTITDEILTLLRPAISAVLNKDQPDA